uniref:Uncharacterized protein n=1 Tax=Fagus sylvatica TaxID=28930 RepID=A0A2N9FT13_FAGSY
MLTRMTLQSGLIRMLMWHHGGVIRGTWHVLAACWRELDTCRHIQARGEHMKTREKEGRHFVGAWKGVKRKGVTPPARGKKGRHSAGAWKRVKRKGVTPPARGKEGLLSDGAWKSVKALMMKISSGTDRSGDVLHRSGVRFSSLKAKKEVWQAMQFTAFLGAEEWKTCKRITAGRNWRSGHRFGAGQRGSDAFVSIDSQKNLKSEFLYRKVLFIPEKRRENGFLCLLVMARGLPGSVGSEDTWCINNPSPGSHWLKRQWKTFTLRETLRKQVKGLEADLQKKDDLLSSQDDTRRFYVGGFEHIRIVRMRMTFSLRNMQSLHPKSKGTSTPSEVQSTSPSGDQSGDPAVSLMDGQVILPPIDKEAP